MRKVNTALASSAVILALMFVGPAGVPASHEGHRYQNHQQRNHQQAARDDARRVASRAGRRPGARRKARRRTTSYVCPMHADIREKARGTCPKCLMDLVAEPRSRASI